MPYAANLEKLALPNVGEVVAAINVSGQQQRTPPVVMLERFLPKLLTAAHQISAMIGGRAA